MPIVDVRQREVQDWLEHRVPRSIAADSPRRRTRVYVSGPYTLGDCVLNVSRAIDAGNILLKAGFAPYVPHLTLLWQLKHAHDYETWLAYVSEFIEVCDCFLQLPGESSGSDRERQRFIAFNGTASRVYLSTETLLAVEKPVTP